MTTRAEAAEDGAANIMSDPSLTPEQAEWEIRRMREALGYDDDYDEPEGFDRDPDCPACLRSRDHTVEEHYAALSRNDRSSRA